MVKTMKIRKIFEDDNIELYQFKVYNSSDVILEFLKINDNEKILSYNDYIITTDGKICLYYYIPYDNKNEVMIKCDLLPFTEKTFIILKKKIMIGGEDND